MKKKILTLMIAVFSVSSLLSIKGNAFENNLAKDVIYDSYKDDYSKFYIRDGVYFFEKADFKKDSTIMFRVSTDGVKKKEYKKEVLAIVPKEVLDRKLPLLYRMAGGSEECEEVD